MNADNGAAPNLWDREGRPFTDTSAYPAAGTQAVVKANLDFAQQTWK